MSAQSGYFDIEVAAGIVRVLWEIENKVLSIRLQARNKDGYYGKYYLLQRNSTDKKGLYVDGTLLQSFPSVAGDWTYQFDATTQGGVFADMEAPAGVPTSWTYNLTNEASVTIAFYGTLYRASPSAHSWSVEGSQAIYFTLYHPMSIYDGVEWGEYKAQINDGSGWNDYKAQIYTGSAWEDY